MKVSNLLLLECKNSTLLLWSEFVVIFLLPPLPYEEKGNKVKRLGFGGIMWPIKS